MTPGKEAPVFACDFGKLGIQICFDIEYDYGWKELAERRRAGGLADAISTNHSPGGARHRPAILHRVEHVADNASFFEPTGKIIGQIREPARPGRGAGSQLCDPALESGIAEGRSAEEKIR